MGFLQSARQRLRGARNRFRKYFEKEENFVKFHQLFARELEVPTEAIALLVQEEMVEWLKSVKEECASVRFKKTWTGEHGNQRIRWLRGK
jgi:hypothetical protein